MRSLCKYCNGKRQAKDPHVLTKLKENGNLQFTPDKHVFET